MPDWLMTFPKWISIDIRNPIDNMISYMLKNWDPFFDGVRSMLNFLLKSVGAFMNIIPWWLMLAMVFFTTWKIFRKIGRAFFYTILLFIVGAMGLWSLMNLTLTIVITSVIISLVIGLPAGILMGISKRSESLIRPVLDTMQTMPSFVYLIPAVMLLGLGNVPAVIATTIYAVPPIIRLSSHGIRQVNADVVEAAEAFGSTRFQTLFMVQIPLALPTIMAGVNQTIMMAISMVVTSSMIGAAGLGSEVIIGINRLESGRGFAAGIAIVIVAILIDRLTQGMFKKSEEGESS